MQTPMEIMIENQKKMVDMWAKAAEDMNTVWKKEDGKKAKKPADLFQNYFEQQQKLFGGQAEVGDPVKMMEKMPDTFQKWMDIQKNFAEQWMEMTKEAGMGANGSNGNKVASEWMDMQMKSWKEWNNTGEEMMEKMGENVLPDPMKPYYKNFRESYKMLRSNWDVFQKMIENNLYAKDWMNQFFTEKAYTEFIDKMMGFHLQADTNESLEQINKAFNSYIEWASEWLPGSKEMHAYWKDFQKKMSQGGEGAFSDFGMNFLDRIRETSKPFFELMDESKNAKFVESVKELQFATMAYVIKSAELQQMAYEAGKDAMPETIRHFGQEWKKGEKMPDFNEFYNSFVNALEDKLLELMKSDEYSVLQNEVLSSGMKMRKIADDLMERQLEHYPVVTRTAYDDLVRQSAEMKRKIRALESKMENMDGKAPAAKKAAPGSGSSAKSTTKKATTKASAKKATTKKTSSKKTTSKKSS